MSKLNYKDLMVGDWVKMNNGYAKVEKLDGEYIHFLDKFGTGISCSAEPIPLNAEILEKNGFTKESDFRWSVPGTKKYCIVNEKVFDGPDSWWFCFNVPDKHKLGHICLFECGNVHELQHILKSGNSDIKIEL